jgi:hypothetical protein
VPFDPEQALFRTAHAPSRLGIPREIRQPPGAPTGSAIRFHLFVNGNVCRLYDRMVSGGVVALPEHDGMVQVDELYSDI